MAVRRIQVQRVYGAPSDRSYCRLRMPSRMINQYVEEHGEERYLWVESPDTLCLGEWGEGRVPIHILDVRERRDYVYRHYRQVMFPAGLARGMRQGDRVDITRKGDAITLKFRRDIFNVDERAAPDGTPRAHARDDAPDDQERRLSGMEARMDLLESRIKRMEGRLAI